MASEPLNHLVLSAASVADDLSYVALAEVSEVIDRAPPAPYRVIGGHMVTALAARWRLGGELYRETADADLGIPPFVIHDEHIVERLIDLGYTQIAGNRFARVVDDVPVHLVGAEAAERQAVVDVLVPAYTSRPRENRRVGDTLVTTEVPGLAMALQRPAVRMTLRLHRLNGQQRDIELAFPDEVSALVLKALVTQVRDKATDIVDIWRCLEVAFAAGVGPDAFIEDDAATAANLIHELVGARNGAGIEALVTELPLSGPAADERITRVCALVQRVVGTR